MRWAYFFVLLTPTLASAQQGPRGFIGCFGDDILNVQSFDDRPQVFSGECDVSTGAVQISKSDYIRDSPDPQCAGDLDETVKRIKPYFDRAAAAGLKAWLGPTGEVAYQMFGENVARELARLVDPRAACVPLSVKLPAGASLRRARFYIFEQLDSNPPFNGYRDKAVDDLGNWSKFESPETIATAAGTVVTAIAKNWSHDHPRWVVMHVVYTPASFQQEKERTIGTIGPPGSKK